MTGDPVWTLEKFRRSGRSHLACGQRILSDLQGAGEGLKGKKKKGKKEPAQAHPGVLPGSAAYLAHVAIECVVKARVLYRSGCASLEDLKRKDPSAHETLFRGRRGHALRFLAESVRLEEILKQEGKDTSIIKDSCWTRMAHDERPYSLRYGAEAPAVDDVEQELQRAAEIVEAVLRGTGPVPSKRQGWR